MTNRPIRRKMWPQTKLDSGANVINKRTIRLIIRQVVSWTAVMTLLVQPVGLFASNCCCDSINAVTHECCNAGQSPACCSQDRNCCRVEQPSCCTKSIAPECDPCSCGDRCLCAATDGPASPVPVAPVNHSETEQTNVSPLTAEPLVDCPLVPDANAQRKSDIVGSYSFTAQQICALLSRFTC